MSATDDPAEQSDTPFLIDIRIVADGRTADQLVEMLERGGVACSRSDVVDVSYLGLDLTTAADIATIVSVAFFSDPVVPFLTQRLTDRARRERIVVETPLGRVTLDTTEHLSPEEIRQRLQRIATII